MGPRRREICEEEGLDRDEKEKHMNKNQRILYLSGLISEEQLAESSDFEHSMASVQKMQSEFNKLSETLLGCLESCEALKTQVKVNQNFYHKSGRDRSDSQGLQDIQYFGDVFDALGGLATSIRSIFGNGRPVDDVEKTFEELVNRLNADFDPA
jgi:hypothetical protein